MSAPAGQATVPRWVSIGLIPLINLTLALLVSGIVVLIIGENPLEAMRLLVYGAFIGYGPFGESIGFTLYYATNFIFTGLCVSMAFHCGLFNIGGESIIILRSGAEEVRAFYNVCRHRGSRICLAPQGHKKVLVCPYHAWSYRLDGSLKAARLMPEGFDAGDYGLHPCHLRLLDGLIFINLAEGEPPGPGPGRQNDRVRFEPGSVREIQ